MAIELLPNLSERSEDHLCKNDQCKAPLNERCRCKQCNTLSTGERKHRVFCHVCTQLYVTIANNSHLQREHAKWQAERDARRKNMGL